MNYAGIDLASKSSAVAVVDEQGNVMEQREVATDTEQLNQSAGPVCAGVGCGGVLTAG